MRRPGDQPRNGRSTTARLARSANLNVLWAHLLVDELVRCGVRLFCVSPGSRSALLALAAAEHHEAEVVVHVDERGSAFAALGWARATGRPACWITTSGTAAANGLPAVVEADADEVPLIALTADRPPELRETGANQTIRQPGMFGEVCRWSADLPAPSSEIDPAFVLTTVDQAVHRALYPGGPIHLNVMFREPLAPAPDGRALPPLPERWLHATGPFTHYAATIPQSDVAGLAERIAGSRRGLIVAGRLKTDDEAAAVAALSRHLGWPLVADVCSGLRLGNDAETFIAHGDLLLAGDSFRRNHRPDCVLRFGTIGASKRVAAYLEESRPENLISIHSGPRRLDPKHHLTERVQGDVDIVCRTLIASAHASVESEWLADWKNASDAVGEVIDRWAEDQEALSEPLAARIITETLEDPLIVAASMPIRDVDSFGSAAGAARRVFANRGASGIDGTIATAAGIARGLGRPVTLFMGDLALLHDLNSLALLRAPDQPPVRIVVINNDGGGIFHLLPISGTTEHFEDVLGTPHGMTFEYAAMQFGTPYRLVETPDEMRNALRAEAGIIELRTDRRANANLHRELLTACIEAVRATEIRQA